MGKHVHAEIIKALAEGAEVQVFRHEYDGYYWEDTATPSFNPDFEYRVKPADKIAEKEPKGFMDFGDPKNWKEFKNDTWDNSNVDPLPEQLKQEPVGYAEAYDINREGHDFWVDRQEGKNTVPLYTAPPKREWVGLTDEERNKLRKGVLKLGDWLYDDGKFMKDIEDKLKEKNT